MILTLSVAVATPCIDSEVCLSFVFPCLLIAVSRSFIPPIILLSNFSDNSFTALRISYVVFLSSWTSSLVHLISF